MSTTRKPRKVRCYNYREFAHVKRDSANPKQERSTTLKYGSLQNSTTHGEAACKARKGKYGANTPPQDEVTNTPPQGDVHSANMMTGPTQAEEDGFGYALAMSSPAPQWEATAFPRPQLLMHSDTWIKLLPFLLRVLTIFVGVWELFHQDLKGTAQMAKVGMLPICESRDDTDPMTMLADDGASERIVDDDLHPRLKCILRNHKEPVTAGRHVLLRTATATASGVIVDDKGNIRRVDLPVIVVPGLGHHLFSAPRVPKTGLAVITDSDQRLEQGQHVLPLQQLDNKQYTLII